MSIVKSIIKVKNDEQILPSNSSKSLSLNLQILLKASRRGWASVKTSMMSSLWSAFNLAGCIAILARLQIRFSHTGAERGEEPFEQLAEAPLPLIRRDRIG